MRQLAPDSDLARTVARRLWQSGVGDPQGRPLALADPPWHAVVGLVGDRMPLSLTDLSLAQTTPERLLRGLGALALLAGARHAWLAIRADWWDRLASLRALAASRRLILRPVPPCYPLDDATLLADLREGAGSQADAFGLDHAVVHDATTLAEVGAALEGSRPPRRTVSVAGDLPRPAVLQVPLGTPFGALARHCGGGALDAAVFHNGPLAGPAAEPGAAVDQHTRALLLLPLDHLLVVGQTTPRTDARRRAASACVGCRVCTDCCPVYLEGAQLQPHQLSRTLALPAAGPPSAGLLAALQCRGCRLCDIVCPSQVAPAALVELARRRLEQQGIALAPTPGSATPRLHPERAGRRLTLARLSERLGLASHALPALPARPMLPAEIHLPLTSPGGLPRIPVVEPGQRVAPGTALTRGEATASLRATMSGRVLSIDPDDGIRIEVA
jgi:Na+-translocating ferredoxin:NAD+ oxidoreductase RnfC subunit